LPSSPTLRITAVFERAAVYNVWRIDTYPGEVFKLQLDHFPVPVDWFANHDSVLEIKESPDSSFITVKALEVGESYIIVQGAGGASNKIFIVVLEDKKEDKAKTLDVTFGKPIPK